MTPSSSEPAAAPEVGSPTRDAILNSSEFRPGVLAELRVLVRYRGLLKHLIVRDIKVRYKRSLLGFLWTMLNPLLTMMILNFVFSEAFRSHVSNYGVYVLAGVLFWNFFSQSSTQAMNALMTHQGLVKIVYMPRSIYAFSVVGSGLVHLALAFVPMILLMTWVHLPVTSALLFLPVGVAAIALFTIGLALLLSTLAVYFTDVVQMYQIVLVAWFYLTPVMFPKDIVPAKYRVWLELNPLAPLLDLFRFPIYLGTLPPPATLLHGAAIAILSFVLGWSVFVRNSDRLVLNI